LWWAYESKKLDEILDGIGFQVILIKGMVCAEKMRLIEKYTAATSALSVATTKLQLKTGVEFRESLAASKEARAKCANARQALLDHKARHGC